MGVEKVGTIWSGTDVLVVVTSITVEIAIEMLALVKKCFSNQVRTFHLNCATNTSPVGPYFTLS